MISGDINHFGAWALILLLLHLVYLLDFIHVCKKIWSETLRARAPDLTSPHSDIYLARMYMVKAIHMIAFSTMVRACCLSGQLAKVALEEPLSELLVILEHPLQQLILLLLQLAKSLPLLTL